MIDTTGKTIQQVSDEIAGKLIKQGKKCLNIGGNCDYGDDEGNHCGIGWLLDESNEAVMGFEGGLAGLIAHHNDLGINDAFIRENYGVLDRVQLLHDDPNHTFHTRSAITNLNLDAWKPWFDLHS
jgi:hypothetical protein